MVNEVDNRPRYCHHARGTLKFFFDTTTRLTPGRVIGGSPPSILKLSRRGETTINRIILGGNVEYSALVRRMLNLNQLHPRPEPSTTDPADNVTVITPVFGQRLHPHPADNGMHIIVVDDARHHRFMMQRSGSIAIADPLRPVTSPSPPSARNSSHLLTPILMSVSTARG
jgi:hypothetical protein